MIVLLQRELVKCGFITNEPIDRSDRYEIHKYLRELLFGYSTDNLWSAMLKFSDNYKNRNNYETIKNKASYFKKTYKNILEEYDVPDISFDPPPKKINKKNINETVWLLIEYSTSKIGGPDWEIFNVLETTENPFHSGFIQDDLYEHAIKRMRQNEMFFQRIIDELIALNDPNKDIGPDLKRIYIEIEKELE